MKDLKLHSKAQAPPEYCCLVTSLPRAPAVRRANDVTPRPLATLQSKF